MSKSLSSRNEGLVSNVRGYLRGLARRRSSQTVTAADAQNYLDRTGMSERMTRTRQAIVNSALMSGEFVSTGYEVPSTRPSAKGRSITEWTLA
jgi:hypothetical protein